MKLNKVLSMVVALLAGALVVQVAVLKPQGPQERWIASWAHSPKTMDEAKNLAKQIVKGRVVNIRRGDDLVVKVPGEPNDEDRIPIEVITFALEGAYKGTAQKTVEVFQTGLSPMPEKGAIPAMPPDKKHGGQPIAAGRKASPTLLERRTVLLDDAPPYKVGEQYALFLMDGPTVNVAGSPVKTQALISPEGRYAITPDDKLRPVTMRAFAGQLRGQKVSALEQQLPKFNPLPAKEWHPKLQELKIKQLEELKQFEQLKQFKQQLQK